MDEDSEPEIPRKRRRLSPPQSGPYALRSVLEDIPLTPENISAEVSITCVEYWNGNLYIGTSASEILHLVALPAAENEEEENPTYILASRLAPSGHGASSTTAIGVRKILVLPGPAKACVLCNGVVSFYSLPELSPAFPSREVNGVQWIGGINENEDRSNPEGPVVMIANSRKILLVRVGERLRSLKNNIEYPGCLRSCRRDTIACVADDKSYTLLEVEHQQKIPLFPISSANNETNDDDQISETLQDSLQSSKDGSAGHGRSVSMGNLPSSGEEKRGDTSPHKDNLRIPGRQRSPQPQQQPQPRQEEGPLPAPLTRPRSSTEALPMRKKSTTGKPDDVLRPHILSPNSSEFMLVTGTGMSEPGVGMFVNLDGDVVRGTIEFSTYPEDIGIANFSIDEQEIDADSEDQIVIALLNRPNLGKGLELHRLPGNNQDNPKVWISLTPDSSQCQAGLHRTLSLHSHVFTNVADLLKSVPLKSNGPAPDLDPRTSSAVQHLEQENALFESQTILPPSVELSAELMEKRAAEETRFARRLGQSKTGLLFWINDQLFQILENPLIIQLEFQLMQLNEDNSFSVWNTQATYSFLDGIRGREPKNETEFLSLKYIMQKASLILFLHLQSNLNSGIQIQDLSRAAEKVLHEGGLDPRVILRLLPPLATEAIDGKEGIWLHQGIAEIARKFRSPVPSFESVPLEFWLMMRHYLTLWQEKRGYGSIADEKHVFDSVDTALIHVLLFLDQALPSGSGVQASCRAKLENTVDYWKSDITRAAALLEQYDRLYLLSRLYQSKKLSKEVLNTWKRILDGENDVDHGSNLEQIEIKIRRYLVLIRDPNLVRDYALWLAQRNPDLALQVFSDDASRVKFSPTEVIEMLQNSAPGLVQKYLEHLVFVKGMQKYADDLVFYYLDSVLKVLEESEEARDSLAQSYSTYRTLTTPKPTYLNFISDNTPQDPWWHSRLRLLQLLGSGGYTTSNANADLKYSVDMVLERLAPYSSFLVSESIILDARRGRHKEALHLLTHGLGDYDTAVRYCYFGSPSGPRTIDASQLPPQEMQRELFDYLFYEFLRIDNIEECLERTSQLLGKFATWFDPVKILSDIPDDWTVDVLSEFLLRSFRSAVSEKNQAAIIKALSAAQNLQKQADFINLCEKLGAKFEGEILSENGPGPTIVA